MKIAVIGTGYVGTSTAIAFAKWGHQVLGVDNNHAKIEQLRSGVLPFHEVNLLQTLREVLHRGNIAFTTDMNKAVNFSDVIFITVGSPSRDDGSADLSYVVSVARELGSLLMSYKTIVMKSTVPVGTCERVRRIIAISIAAQGNEVEFDIVSNPEFLQEGRALQDALLPERIVVGCDSNKAKSVMEKLYKNRSKQMLMTSITNAEMIKYASNAFLATKISFVNELARLCERLNVDIQSVAAGMGMDSRIGSHFLHAGIGYGGSCFPKDVNALIQLGAQYDVPLLIPTAVVEINSTQVEWFLDKVRHVLGDLAGRRIAMLGLAFKPNTDDIREAPSLRIIHGLLQSQAMVSAYDPVAAPYVRRVYQGVNYADTPLEAVEQSDAVVLVTEWSEIVNMDWERARNAVRLPNLFDGRNALDPEQMRDKGFHYFGIARPEDKAGGERT